MSVNLLPTNLKPSAGVQKVTKIINNITSLLLVLFVLMTVVFVGVYIFNRTTINKVKSSNDQLTTRIESLENTEQSVYLLRDRLEKLNRIKSKPSLDEYLDDAKLLTSFVSDDVVIEFLDVTQNNIKFGISTNSSEKVTGFLTDLQSSNLFTNVKMESLNYNENLGFTADFTIRN